jgi:hypothetical protein
VAGLALIASSAWLAASAGEARWIPASVSGLIVLIGALGTVALRRRSEGSAHTSRADSVERSVALDARAGAFVGSLVIGVVLGACLWVFDLGPYAGALVTLYLVFVILDFWLRYAVRG